jgi:hypothetical protein
MGVDLYSVPVLLDSEPIQMIRRDPVAWEAASGWPPFADFDDDDVDDDEGTLPEVNQAMLADRPPGLDAHKDPWHLGSRDFMQAEYALAPAAFCRLDSYTERERSLPYRIVFGDRFFADHAVSMQGMPWRCSTRAFLVEAADTIGALDETAVRREFSVPQMFAHGVYKTAPNSDEDKTFARAMENLRWLGRYYRDVAAYDHDLIVMLE